MIFETKRLVFRKPIRQDFMRLWQMLNDPIAKKYTGGVTKLSYQQRLALFEQECLEDFSPQGTEFAVIEKESGNYLGYCGFRYSEQLCGCEFLFGYCRDCWGKGYATESAQSVLNILFETYCHNVYIATVDPQTIAKERDMPVEFYDGFNKTYFFISPVAKDILGYFFSSIEGFILK